MTITKSYIKAIITAMAVIAAATTIAFPNSTVYATTTTASPETAGQQEAIHITKDGTNSYIITGTMSSIGSFDTTYRVVGERSAIRSAENLIISTITDDFSSSRTIGYITPGGTTTDTGATSEPTLPSPFASPEQITERITTELRRVITEAESNTPQGQHVEIKCDFGMSLEDMRCHYVPLLEEAGATASESGATAGSATASESGATADGSTDTATTTTSTNTTDDISAPISPLEGE